MSDLISSYIKGSFNGWSGETLFILGNGQYWVQTRYAYRYRYAYRPKVTIKKEDGSFFLEVQEMDDRIQVRRINDVIESNIDGEFNGWDGETTFKLSNGQIWKQSSYAYHYYYSYRPEVVIYNPGPGYRLMVDGVTETIPVRQIR